MPLPLQTRLVKVEKKWTVTVTVKKRKKLVALQ
jgi:hypothetical protein